MTALIDLTNKKFGDLVVISRDLSKINRVYWICVCICGRTASTSSNRLLSKTRPTKSCGCLRKEINHYKNYDDKISAITILYLRYKADAKIRNKEFSLAKEEFETIIIKNCNYCNDSPNKQVQRKNRKDKFKVYDFKYNGIDRKDNNVGYLVSNCVPCCSICNRAKDIMSEEDFLNWVARIHKHRNANG